MVPSFSRPSERDDNPHSEALFRTLKYTPAYPRKRFEDLDQAPAWVQAFVTPEHRLGGEDNKIFHKRKGLFDASKCSKVQQSGSMEVKANAQLGPHQRGVAEPDKGVSEDARKRGSDGLEKRTTSLTKSRLLGSKDCDSRRL